MSAPPGLPFVVAQLGQSLDGRIATQSGESRWINRDAALDHLHRLRAAVDAVVVGVGTVIADDPRLTVRRGVPTPVKGQPVRVVIDPTGRIPASAKVLAADGARRILVCCVEGPGPQGCETITLEHTGGRIAPHRIVEALFTRGLHRILIEGGASTVSAFIDAGAVDRLHLLVAPLILGSGKPGLTLSPVERLAQAARPKTAVHVLDDGDVLFDCDLRPSR